MIKNWIAQSAVYPPAHIYAGMPQGKKEKQAVTVCESLYRFNFGDKPNLLGNLRSAYRELEVIQILGGTIKKFQLDKIVNEFLDSAKAAIDKMDYVFKQHQDVNEYYKTWRLGFQTVKAEAQKIQHSFEVYDDQAQRR